MVELTSVSIFCLFLVPDWNRVSKNSVPAEKSYLVFSYKPEPEQEPEFNFFSSPELPDNSYHLSKK